MLWQDRCNFYLAIQKNDLELAGRLIRQGLDVDARFQVSSGSKPVLCICAQRGHLQMAKLLIRSGCNVNQTDNAGCTPLHFACLQRREDMVELLIQYGANVNLCNFDSNTALHIAVDGGGCLGIVKKLVTAGCNLNAQNCQGASPLVTACIQGKIDCVRYLIDHGASVNLQDVEGNIALIHATHFSAADALKVILNAGSVVNHQNKDGLGPLHAAVLHSRTGQSDVVETLVNANCNLDATTHLGQTALHLAVLQQKYDLAEVMIRAGCNLNVRDKLGHRTLYSLVRAGELRCARLMVRAGINLRQESWLHDKHKLPLMDDKEEEFVLWLKEQAASLPSLMFLCRVSIRKTLGRHADKHVLHLHLPVLLRRYLLLEE